MRIMICGGAGFIGSHFTRIRLREYGDQVIVLDKLTYAGRMENLADLDGDPGFSFVHAAIEDAAAVRGAIENAGAGLDAVVNFAARPTWTARSRPRRTS